ncbi:hypothetical protein HW555_013349 [Spodoptera exigua]|uniref:Uncharacterized protein n=1 Tax=Spodoptera exigua TaxID=7107 RepID=A0A835G488_SPOEX|nr:hypothetical protein HW555_013349 [Spodoptera exigua]
MNLESGEDTISSQPLEDKENVRQTRQLDFGECCPCPGAGQVGQGFEAQSPSFSSFDGPYSRARDMDDCPCRGRSADSEGATSVFFPTAVRPDGHVVRPTEPKEDPKPLLHPEVDLASSVLETLREATDEEYKEALARDAARSMGKSADEAFFGDTIPDASTGNLVTIIMNPKHSEGLDDIVPQESRVQESRCGHGPLGSASLGLPQSHQTYYVKLFGLPQVDQLEDMDSSAGASTIQERVVKVEESEAPSKTKIGIRKYAPVLNTGTDTIINDISSNLEGNSKPDLIEDMSVSPSDIQELAKKNFFEAKSHLDTILQNAHTRPMSLKNLLKLKDVEFVPLQDLVKTRAETPKLTVPQLNLPGIFDTKENYDRSKCAS